MATSIVSPNSGMDNIDSAFSRIYSMLGSATGAGGGSSMFGGFSPSSISGGGSGPFGISPQPVSGADNSLTAMFRGTSNLLGQTGPQTWQMGTGMLGTGVGVAEGGLGVMGEGLQTMQPAQDFWSKILSGDPSTTTAALAPTAANLAQIYSGAVNQAGQGMPAGGYRAATLAGLPFAQAAQVGNAALALQPQAAQALQSLGGEQANIGQGMAGVGTTISGQGTALTGQGLQGVQNLIADLLDKQRINQNDPTALQQAAQVISIGASLFGTGA